MAGIVVGIDGSANARRALEWAADESRLRDVALRAVLAWDVPVATFSSVALASVDAARLESRRTIADAVEAIAALGYSRGDARRMVADAMADDSGLESLEQITLAVLRRLDVRS